MHISDTVFSAVISGGVAAGASWLTFMLTFFRKFGSLESDVAGIKEDIKDIRDEKDVVRWSQLAMMGNITFPGQRTGASPQ